MNQHIYVIFHRCFDYIASFALTARIRPRLLNFGVGTVEEGTFQWNLGAFSTFRTVADRGTAGITTLSLQNCTNPAV
eukprot:COSAG02_NODE_2235_length_9420_cov_27.032722_9_plen_77_part_00